MAMVTSTDVHLAAALAAAAELAKNGDAYLLTAATVQELQTQSLKVTLPPAAAIATTVAAPLAPLTLTPNIAALLSTVAGSSISIATPSAVASKQDKYATDEDASDDDNEDEDDAVSNNENDTEHRIARSRERNREHARRTRLRKKAQLQDLQSKVRGLQAESRVLKQSLEECSIASILVGLSTGERDATIQSLLKDATKIESREIFQVVAGKRKRFLSDASSSEQRDVTAHQVVEIKVNSKSIKVGGGRSQINWKSGFYMDEDGVQRQLTFEQLESLR
jgi:ABC-type transport system involved in cytochrome bd biosynthesis fused ATPase/permease subunit